MTETDSNSVTPFRGAQGGQVADVSVFLFVLFGRHGKTPFFGPITVFSSQALTVASSQPCGFSTSSSRSMDSGPGKLVGEDCRAREVCDKMASGVTGSMELDAASIGGGAASATTRGATARTDFGIEQGGDCLELPGGAVAGIGVAAADRTANNARHGVGFIFFFLISGVF